MKFTKYIFCTFIDTIISTTIDYYENSQICSNKTINIPNQITYSSYNKEFSYDNTVTSDTITTPQITSPITYAYSSSLRNVYINYLILIPFIL
jgi:hypothetical protein